MRTPHVPAPLMWLLVAVAVAGIAWVFAVPPWQVPDEDAHFAYVQTVAELGRRPSEEVRPALEAQKSSEQDSAERASGFLRSYQRLEAHPEWAARPEQAWRAASEPSRDDGGGANAAESYLPAYYLYAAVPYLAASGGDVLDRLYATRLFSVLLLLTFAVSAWLLAGEVLGRDRHAQLLAAAIAGLVPMATFIGSAVTPDALLLPVWGLWFWLAARVLRRLQWRDALLLAGLTGAGICVKPTSLALLPGLVWVGAAFLWRRGGRSPLRSRTVGSGSVAVLVLGAIMAVAVAAGTPRQLAAYLWQFYSPFDSGGYLALPQWPLRDVWLEGAAGAFGWLEVRFPWPVYALVALLLATLLAATLPRLRLTALGVTFALPALALVAGLHLTELDMLLNQGKAFTQGRYLLPLLPLLALVAASVVRSAALTGGLLGGLAAWQLVSLAIVMARFHA
jgi:4-amino-4-deoxy-L-arabinose transferase-like glycosyltransferase